MVFLLSLVEASSPSSEVREKSNSEFRELIALVLDNSLRLNPALRGVMSFV